MTHHYTLILLITLSMACSTSDPEPLAPPSCAAAADGAPAAYPALNADTAVAAANVLGFFMVSSFAVGIAGQALVLVGSVG